MTTDERVQALADYGFTQRQARFLVLVMRHSGLCVKRQYADFAGIANGGEKCNAFFDKLVGRGHAVVVDCIHNRARLYRIHHRPLYYAIGQPDSRYRRPIPARSVTERLMRLDAALMSPNLDWLTTRSEKVAYLRVPSTPESNRAVDTTTYEAPSAADQFPGTFPIGIDPSGRVVLIYVATVPWTDDFRTFLVGHAALLSVTPAWTLRLVFPQPLRHTFAAYQTVVYEELESPLQTDTIYDLKRYFFHRRRGTDLNAIPEALKAFLSRCAKVFAGPRFSYLYQRWLTENDAALVPLSPVIHEALASGHAQVECLVLPHTYQHLSPLVSRRPPCRRRRKLDERGDATPHAVNPSLNPVP
jgi:hypothetical protein